MEWMKIYGNHDKRRNKKLNMLLDRAIGKAGYASRKLTSSQNISMNWCELVERERCLLIILLVIENIV